VKCKYSVQTTLSATFASSLVQRSGKPGKIRTITLFNSPLFHVYDFKLLYPLPDEHRRKDRSLRIICEVRVEAGTNEGGSFCQKAEFPPKWASRLSRERHIYLKTYGVLEKSI